MKPIVSKQCQITLYWHFCCYLNAQLTITRQSSGMLESAHGDLAIFDYFTVQDQAWASPLSPHHRHNKFMNEKLSNKPDEERRAVTTCHSVITLIVNIQASELSTSLPCLSLALSYHFCSMPHMSVSISRG